MVAGDQIVSVRAWVVKDATAAPQGETSEMPEVLDWQRSKVAHPLTKYPEFRDSRSAAIGGDGRTIIVEVESASGHVGIGLTNGGVASAAIVELLLARMVEGQSAFAHDVIWDRMFGSTMLYGRKGIVLHAISAVDLAVWDLHGRIAAEPVYALSGGAAETKINVYGTGPNAGAMHALGMQAAKLPLTWGPSEGEEGFRLNVERARRAREATAPDFPLFMDCWMALDVEYAVRLSWALADLGYRWIEEPLPPDDYAGHAELRRRMPPGMTLNTGEHEYTARGFKLLCDAGVDILQPDPNWCGGLTELRRIAAVASASGKRIIPHVGTNYSFHFLATYPEATFGEVAVMAGNGDQLKPLFDGVLTGEFVPSGGTVLVDDAPGFGLDIADRSRLVRVITRDILTQLT